MTSPTKPNNELRMIADSLAEQNTQLKTLLARKNNEIEQLKGNYKAINDELLALRRKLTEKLTEGRFQEKVKTLVG